MSKHVTLGGMIQEQLLSFEYLEEGEGGVKLDPLDVSAVDLNQVLKGVALRSDGLSGLPQLSEFETVRHFTRLSKMNVSIDAAMYPLGSCTMKYNPRINEVVSRIPAYQNVHPLAPDKLAQGTMEVMWHLQEALLEISGFDAVSLQPAAGAQGELTGVFLIRTRLKQKGEQRPIMLIPDSSHGTNPASAVIAGFEVKELKSTEQGTMDIEHLHSQMDERVAGLMLTNPNTLGIFEPQIKTIVDIVHDKGGYIYCDGANMNAQVGVSRPGDYGMDVMHINLHKTFSTPHGGGGPGAGPCLCTKELEPFLPVPRIEAQNDRYVLNWDKPHSVGKLVAFYGNTGILLRALSYIKAMGGDGLSLMSRVAVLNANYLKYKLQNVLQCSTNLPTMHEVVFTDKTLAELGVSTLDVAKRLLDYGFHPPTIYFPLTVSGALMIEPTESEPKAELDRFVEAFHAILSEAKENPELVKSAPHCTPRRRLDEVNAARNPILRWQKN